MNEHRLMLRRAQVPGRGVVDVLIENENVARIAPVESGPHDGSDSVMSYDLEGYLLLPAAVEPHAHLDKALLWDRAQNLTGDLLGAIEAHHSIPDLQPDETRGRASKALDIALRRGFTAVRSHVNVEPGLGTTLLEALLDLRSAVADSVDLDLVALTGFPITGEEGRENRALLDRALGLGVQAVGGAPALDPDPDGAVNWLVAAARAADRPIDLHLDETLDAGVLSVRTFARAVERHGLGGRATASHCVSLGQQPEAVAREIAAILRDVGIGAVVLPQTNLGLQGRGEWTRVARATAPARLLRDVGVRIAGGSDNWRDMFNPLGRIDPFETAGLMVAVCHLGLEEAYRSVSTDAAAVLGLPRRAVDEGFPAELLAIRADGLAEAIADAGEDRIVVHRGRIVARTHVVKTDTCNL